jgi:hypothetical protein
VDASVCIDGALLLCSGFAEAALSSLEADWAESLPSAGLEATCGVESLGEMIPRKPAACSFAITGVADFVLVTFWDGT